MSMYTAKEEIEGYKNEAGKEVPACKQVKLEQLPMVLVSLRFLLPFAHVYLLFIAVFISVF